MTAPQACERCGQPHVTRLGHPSCVGHRKHDGGPCTQNRMHGSTVCKKHGGMAPQVREAAARRLAVARAEAEVQRELIRNGEVPQAHPLDVLLERVWRSAAFVRVLEQLVSGLAVSPDETEDEGAAIYGPDHSGDQRSHVYLELLGQWSDRAARYSKLALDAGVAEREIRLAERQGEIVANLIRSVLEDPELALDAGQREVAGLVAQRHLRALPA